MAIDGILIESDRLQEFENTQAFVPLIDDRNEHHVEIYFNGTP
jgi:hypothetical protein